MNLLDAVTNRICMAYSNSAGVMKIVDASPSQENLKITYLARRSTESQTAPSTLPTSCSRIECSWTKWWCDWTMAALPFRAVHRSPISSFLQIQLQVKNVKNHSHMVNSFGFRHDGRILKWLDHTTFVNTQPKFFTHHGQILNHSWFWAGITQWFSDFPANLSG